jgi:hydroxymethylbilane synthase
VAGELATRGVETQIVLLTTLGDVKAGPIRSVGAQGVFTKEIQRALLADDVDLAVHSLKDLPTDAVDGLELAAVPPRETVRDVLASAANVTIADLPPGARVGTGSARRRAQLLAFRPDLDVREVRGNVETRLRKLREGEFDALVLAEAGLRRLGLTDQIAQLIPTEVMLPAVGQGALGLEIRTDDDVTRAALTAIDDFASHQAVLAERALLRGLRGGCLAPIAAWARPSQDASPGEEIALDAVVLSGDGERRLSVAVLGPQDGGAELGQAAAEKLLAQGAEQLLAAERDGVS